MTTDERCFLDDINAAPADLTTRLVYADWLADRGRTAEEAGWRWAAAAGYARRRRVWDLIDFRGVGLSAAEAACLPAGEAYYRLRSRSEAAVSAAIVAYGRRLVDLPPLSPPPAPG